MRSKAVHHDKRAGTGFDRLDVPISKPPIHLRPTHTGYAASIGNLCGEPFLNCTSGRIVRSVGRQAAAGRGLSNDLARELGAGLVRGDA